MIRLTEWKKVVALAAISVSVLASSVAAVPAQEADPDENNDGIRDGYAGAVIELEDDSIVVELRDDSGNSPEIAITDATEVRTPGADDVKGTLEVGARVAILAQQVDDGTWAALQIVVRPTGPSIRPVTGAVVSVENGVMTIALPNGETKTIELGPDAEEPDEGEVVTAFEDHRGNRPTVTGLARASQVRERLENFVTEARERVENGEASRAQALARLAVLLDRQSARNVEILQGLLDSGRLPEQAQVRVAGALQHAQDARANVEARIENIRTRLDHVREIIDNLPTRGPDATRAADRDGIRATAQAERDGATRPTARAGN